MTRTILIQPIFSQPNQPFLTLEVEHETLTYGKTFKYGKESFIVVKDENKTTEMPIIDEYIEKGDSSKITLWENL